MDLTTGLLALSAGLDYLQGSQTIQNGATRRGVLVSYKSEKFSSHSDKNIVSLERERFRLPARLRRLADTNLIGVEKTLEGSLFADYNDLLFMRPAEQIEMDAHPNKLPLLPESALAQRLPAWVLIPAEARARRDPGR